jgi:chorismate mutase
MAVSEKIGEYKRENNITILQLTHWKNLFDKSLDTAHQLGLPKDFIKAMYQLIHDESIRRQTDIMNKK